MSTGKTVPEGETRYWPTQLETRSLGTLRRIGGVGVPYGQRSRMLPGGFTEIVNRHAFAKTLSDCRNVVCLMEHHPEWLLGNLESGTLRLTDEDRGLSYECDLPNTQAGNDCYELIRTNRMPYSSMGFNCFQDEFTRDGQVLVRHLLSIRLNEVGPVAQPGYLQTSTAIRSLARQVDADIDDVETLAAQGELRSLLMRTDQQVTAPPTILPATAEARSVTPGDLDRRIRENRDAAVEFNRDSRLQLDRLMERNRQIGDSIELERHLAESSRNMFPGNETRSYWWTGERVPVTVPPPS